MNTTRIFKNKRLYLIFYWMLLLVFSAQIHADETVEKLTLSFSNLPLSEAIKRVEAASSYTFFYDVNKTDLQQRVSLNAADLEMDKAMGTMLTTTDLTFTITNRQIALIFNQRQEDNPQKRITGTVVDDRDEPVIGANVMEKGGTNGTVTDLDGAFVLEVKENAVLQVSFIGYRTQDVNVGRQSELNIRLAEDNLALEEVVVVGYGTQKKVTLTGSVVSTKGADIVKSPAVNVTNSLAGRLPGVIINNRSGEPGRENTSLYIRGRSTTGNASALVLIDGIERGGLENINPNDIESISVLKDASAAIYGARAANGVILVTTKRGSSPRPVIDFSYNQGFSQPTRNPRMADSYTFFTVYNEIEASEGRPARWSDADLQKFREGKDPNYANIDWYDYIIRKWTPQHRANVSVSGSGERAKYYVSLGELSQDDMYRHGTRKYNQYNIRSNVDVKLSESLTVGANLAGRYDDRHYPYESANNLNSHIFLYQPNWLPHWSGTDYLTPNRDNENILNWVSDNAGYTDQDVKTMQSSVFFNWRVPWIKGLTIDGTGSYDAGSVFTKTFRIPTYVYYRNDAGEYTRGRAGSGVDKSTLTDRGEFSGQLYFTVKATYERTVGQHNLGAMVGYEQQKVRGNYLQAYRSDYTSTSIPQIFAGSSDKSMQSNDGSASQGARQNIYGRLSYDYAGKYMAQFTMRRDGSPNFPKEKRFGYFPGVSAGWRLSEEPFMQGLDKLDNLKIRGSYGVMGNDLVNAFQYLTTYGYGRNYVIGGTDVSGLQETNVPNPNITWETAKTWNIGLDAALWNGLLGIEFDYFKTRRSDILTRRSAIIPSYTGLTLPDENIGIVDNKGFELILTHANSINDFRYSLSANVSFARNKVIFSDEQPAAEPYQYATGRPIGSFLLYNSLGIFRDQAAIDAYPHLPGTEPGDIIYEDVNKDGEIDSRDRVRQDLTNIPEIVYGINAYFEYKGFDLSLLFQGQENARQSFGGRWFPVMSYSFGNFLNWRAEDRWSPTNTDASMPRASYALWNNSTNSVYNSTHWMKNSGFLRLKNMELGYRLPKNICNQIRIQELRLSVSAYNLFIIYDHMKDLGFDPETSDFWYYQQQRTLNFGINVTY